MSQGAEQWAVVHEELTEALRTFARDPAALRQALQGSTLEQAVNAQLGQACLAHGYQPPAYVAALQANVAATRELDRLIGALLQSPLVMETRREAVLNEVRGQLATFDAVFTGEAEGDPMEIAQLRELLADMARNDPEMPGRVHRAAQKDSAAFGRCETCGDPIPAGRLQLVVYAERCTPCQVKFEGPNLQPPPPAIPFSTFELRSER